METNAPSVCPKCESEIKHIPAGVSKTKVDKFGSPAKYNEFWACEAKCGYSWPEKRGVSAPKYDQDKLLEAIKIVNENVKIAVSLLKQLTGQ